MHLYGASCMPHNGTNVHVCSLPCDPLYRGGVWCVMQAMQSSCEEELFSFDQLLVSIGSSAQLTDELCSVVEPLLRQLVYVTMQHVVLSLLFTAFYADTLAAFAVYLLLTCRGIQKTSMSSLRLYFD